MRENKKHENPPECRCFHLYYIRVCMYVYINTYTVYIYCICTLACCLFDWLAVPIFSVLSSSSKRRFFLAWFTWFKRWYYPPLNNSIFAFRSASRICPFPIQGRDSLESPFTRASVEKRFRAHLSLFFEEARTNERGRERELRNDLLIFIFLVSVGVCNVFISTFIDISFFCISFVLEHLFMMRFSSIFT